eukprot:CAMPEP_0194754274 /NCGR_PEP_ID=MMETSP0323_2-20130528/8234_1 /TAXON_ID=2866 ORGANISM="Crypthecodinium cohnii, Strain Seligo" /NCGR_SAMPLE_ID=MMETSP0323_2 /ASSEMBLY_ACC=CAM_ASM_000346 /LENGTH=76 /DNA_ID=CAMNT_0039672687 /DNA_START=37 /DNA_END=267 /DNA_ORIENTATION=-
MARSPTDGTSASYLTGLPEVGEDEGDNDNKNKKKKKKNKKNNNENKNTKNNKYRNMEQPTELAAINYRVLTTQSVA